jgi:hypothetical protein
MIVAHIIDSRYPKMNGIFGRQDMPARGENKHDSA